MSLPISGRLCVGSLVSVRIIIKVVLIQNKLNQHLEKLPLTGEWIRVGKGAKEEKKGDQREPEKCP